MSSAEDEWYICSLCSKVFASSVALENHAKNQHFDTYCQGDTDKWYGGIIVRALPSPVPDGRPNAKKASLMEIKEAELKKEAVLSSMSQAPITALASIDVGMIILKQEEDDISPAVWHKKRVKKKKDKARIPMLENSSICSECGKQYLLNHKLASHMRKAHKIMLEKVMCDVCGKGFKYRSSLKRHIAEHETEVHACPECPKTFSNYSALKNHYLDHSEKRLYACDICKCVLNAKNDLDEHYSKVHSLTKPYQCHLCERTFNQEHSLKIHMNASHKASTTYTCKFCLNIFSDPQSLTMHENKSHKKRKRTSEINQYEQQGDDVES